jgi:serine/threonine-protein kinase HipA
VFNECFCLALAGQMKLTVASAAIHRVADRVHLLVDRYDRVRESDGALQRLLQEDFCQALGEWVSNSGYAGPRQATFL